MDGEEDVHFIAKAEILRPLANVEGELCFALPGLLRIDLQDAVFQVEAGEVDLHRLLVEHLEVRPAALFGTREGVGDLPGVRAVDGENRGHSGLIVDLHQEGPPALLHQHGGRGTLLDLHAALRVYVHAGQNVGIENPLDPRDGLPRIGRMVQEPLQFRDFLGGQRFAHEIERLEHPGYLRGQGLVFHLFHQRKFFGAGDKRKEQRSSQNTHGPSCLNDYTTPLLPPENRDGTHRHKRGALKCAESEVLLPARARSPSSSRIMMPAVVTGVNLHRRLLFEIPRADRRELGNLAVTGEEGDDTGGLTRSHEGFQADGNARHAPWIQAGLDRIGGVGERGGKEFGSPPARVSHGLIQSSEQKESGMSETAKTRRQFLYAAGAAALAEQVIAQTSSSSATGLPTRVLGRTKERVSIIGIGGAHLGRTKDESESFRMLHLAIDEGMTFMDNAWEYNNGWSEEVMGKGLEMDGLRKKAFVMTKVCSREYAGAKQQLEESLKRLRTDHLDLWQFHECNYHNDPEWVFEKGALKAALEAKKEGKVRFIGFTGHKSPLIHLKMLSKDFDWDTAQMPNNVMDSGFLSFREEVMPVCLKKNAGIIGMKGCCGDGRIVKQGIVTLEEAYRYFLSQPVSVQCLGLSSVEEVKEAIRIARNFKPLTATEKQTLLSKIKDVQSDGRYELFKTSKRYDSAYHRTQHGFAVEGA